MICGPALVLGDNVNTDVLHPSKFYSLDDSKVRSGFLRAVDGREGDADADLQGRIVIAGSNFGCGSSRETGARVFLLAGVQAVIAVSFARIFHRNLLNLGLPALACPELSHHTIQEGQAVRLDLSHGALQIGDIALATDGLDPHWQHILDAGGLAPWLGLEGG
jgi:3-isopropylmalate/(R)-2-methylmalate dehydratase small subunit